MSSVFSFDDVPTLDAVYDGSAQGYVYSRMSNPGIEGEEVWRLQNKVMVHWYFLQVWQQSLLQLFLKYNLVTTSFLLRFSMAVFMIILK